MTLSRFFRILRHRLRSLVRKEELDSELDREFAFHLDHLIQENIDRGMRPEDATRAARRVLGNATVLQGICRDERRVSWLQDVAQDLRYGVRMLRKNPSFTFVAAISLALGIGANTAILSAIDSVMRGSLPYADPDRLVMIRTYRFQNPGQLGSVSLPDYFAWKQENHSFESIGASLANQSDLDSDDDGSSPEHLIGKLFSPELFPTLGVQPLIGRVFSETDFRPGQPPSVVLISHDLWQRRFGGDRQILNQRLRLNGQPVSVIGVMPQYFPYSEEKVDYWLPMTLVRPTENTARVFIVTARLKSGVSLQQAQADLSSIAEDLAVDFPERNNGWGVRVQPLREFLYGWTKPALLTLETAIVLVLLIACANVAGLLLARGAARAPEIAMRVALGAGRWRIIRQLLTESVLLAFVGGTLGLVVCRWGLSGIASMVPPPGAPRLAEFTITFRMLGIAAITSLITGLGFGLVPVVATFKSDLARPSVSRAGGALIAGQLAIAFVLLIGFGLLTNSFLRLASRDFNFDSKGLLTFDFRIPQQSYMHDIGSYRDARYFEINPNPALVLQRLYERLRQLPGAVSVAGTSHQPVNSLIVPSAKVVPENLQTSNGVPVANAPTTSYFLVTPNFFATLRSPLMRGRDFDDHDTASTPWVAIINETAARRFWPGEDPIGKRFILDTVPEERYREVIGQVRDIPTRTRRITAEPVIYLSFLQQPSRSGGSGNMFGQMTYVVRTQGDPMSLALAARKAAAEVDPQRPLANMATIEGYVWGPLPELQKYLLVLGTFAFSAMLLAAIGVYGVISYSVTQRTREIAIRAALGASARQLIALAGRQVFVLIPIGLITGFIGSLGLTRLLASQLWGITSTDPATFAAVSLLLAVVALLACLIPARRAIQVDPTVALKSE